MESFMKPNSGSHQSFGSADDGAQQTRSSSGSTQDVTTNGKKGKDARNSKPVGVALFGLGRIGRIHFESLLANSYRLRLLYVVDELVGTALEMKAKWCLHELQVIQSKDAHLVYADVNVLGIIICTPTNTHTDIILNSIQAGKHVMCEKPISLTLSDTELCYQEAERAGLNLFCTLNRRFDPMFRSLKKKLNEGTVGHTQFVQHFVRDHPEPSASTLNNLGSMIHDMAIHGVDLISWLVNERPNQVVTFANAHVQAYKDRGDFDAFGLMLKYPSGLIGYIDSCRYAPYGYDQKLEVVGTKGALIVETNRDNTLVLRDPNGDHFQPIQSSFPDRFKESYRAEIDHFAGILYGEEELCVKSEDVIAAMKMTLAAEESVKTNKIIDITY